MNKNLNLNINLKIKDIQPRVIELVTDEYIELIGILYIDGNEEFAKTLKQQYDKASLSTQLKIPAPIIDTIVGYINTYQNKTGIMSQLLMKLLMTQELYIIDGDYENKLKMVAEKYKTIIPKY